MLWIVIVALLVIVAIRLWRGGGGAWYRSGDHAETAEEILHRRLANGDIDVDEYERRMTALRAQRPPGR